MQNVKDEWQFELQFALVVFDTIKILCLPEHHHHLRQLYYCTLRWWYFAKIVIFAAFKKKMYAKTAIAKSTPQMTESPIKVFWPSQLFYKTNDFGSGVGWNDDDLFVRALIFQPLNILVNLLFCYRGKRDAWLTLPHFRGKWSDLCEGGAEGGGTRIPPPSTQRI